ncbi:MAG: hypothetical protein K2N72_09275 [Oscillospiraceae bacterium]|nr:hypothetical protein [Oscillospiraceae bacterium]
MTNMTDMTDVSRWGGFILDEARRKMKSGMADGVFMLVLFAVFSVSLTVFYAIVGRASLLSIVLIFLLGVMLMDGLRTIRTARKNYRSITEKADLMGEADYSKAALDVSKAQRLGGFYCGGEWLYSPYGLLCKWEETVGIEAEIFYGMPHSGHKSFARAVIAVSLKNGGIAKGTVLVAKDLTALNEGFDGFAKYAESNRVSVSRKFTQWHKNYTL